MNINIFRKQMSNYAFAYGQSYIHDHQDDYDQYYEQALEIVNKYLNK
jgi:nicotinamide riboside kinase